jgi:hypothetical protein
LTNGLKGYNSIGLTFFFFSLFLLFAFRSEWKVFIVISEGIMRVVPVVALTILNVAMIFKFQSVARRRRAISTRSNSRQDAARAEERRKLVLMSTIIVLFVCFNSPSAVLSMIYREDLESTRSFEIFRAVSNDCELANFAVNFYAYFLCSTDFRKAFFDTLCSCFVGKWAAGHAHHQTGKGTSYIPSSADAKLHCTNFTSYFTLSSLSAS